MVSVAPPGPGRPPPPVPKVNGIVPGVAAAAPKLNCIGAVAGEEDGAPPKEKGATPVVVVDAGGASVEPAALADPNGAPPPAEKGEAIDAAVGGAVTPKGGGTAEPMAIVEEIPPPAPAKGKADPKGVLDAGAAAMPPPPPPPPKVKGLPTLPAGAEEEGREALIPVSGPVPAAVALVPNPKAPRVAPAEDGGWGAPLNENPSEAELTSPPGPPTWPPKLKGGTAEDLERDDDSPTDVVVFDPNAPKVKVAPAGAVGAASPPPATLDAGMAKLRAGTEEDLPTVPPEEGSVTVAGEEGDLLGLGPVPTVKYPEGGADPPVVPVSADGLAPPAVTPNVNNGGGAPPPPLAPSLPVDGAALAVPATPPALPPLKAGENVPSPPPLVVLAEAVNDKD